MRHLDGSHSSPRAAVAGARTPAVAPSSAVFSTATAVLRGRPLRAYRLPEGWAVLVQLVGGGNQAGLFSADGLPICAGSPCAAGSNLAWESLERRLPR